MEEEKLWLETILNKNIINNSISKVLKYDIVGAVPAGNNYVSIISRVTLEVILRDGRKSKKSVIMKKKHESKDKSKRVQDLNMFKCETNMYKEVLPKFHQLQEEYQDNNDRLWGNLIGYKPYDTIIFEDLKTENFKMADRRLFLDKNHSLLVLNSLGRFHALGHILLEKGLIKKDDLPPFYIEKADVPQIKNLFSGGIKSLCKILEKHWSSEWKEIIQNISKEADVINLKLKDLCVSQDNSFMTVCHGDCWTCNVMFKYCPYDDKIPVALKFVDFQTSYVNTFAFDVTYFCYTSVNPDIRRNCWNELISEYHKSLTSTLAYYNMADKAPSMDQINAEMQRLKYYAFVTCALILPITNTDENKAIDLDKLSGEETEHGAFNPEVFKSERYKNAVQLEFKQWFKDGLFN